MLLIDSGNSAVKTRLFTADGHEDRVFPLHHGFEASGLVDYLAALDVSRVHVASVASVEVRNRLRELLPQQLPDARVDWLETLPELAGISNAYHDYTRLGVDRWLTLLAAVELTTHDAIIIDAGSAITIDLLSRQQGHLGGAILPGFNTTLARFHALFPGIDFTSPEVQRSDAPGRSTAACLHADQAPATAVQVAAIIRRWQGLLSAPVDILLTGQDAARIAAALDLPYRIVPDLVFIGMLKQIQCLG